jgi:hypothetical protein
MNITTESSSAMPWLVDPRYGGMSSNAAEASYRAALERQRRDDEWEAEREREIAERRDEMVRRWEANDPRERPVPSPNGSGDYGAERQRAKQIGPRMDELPLTIEQWRARDLPEPDFICGKWLSTTSRVLISAPTGLGKSNLVIALGQHIGAGLPFLHWNATRPAKVLYVDGEMSRRLLRQRIFAEADRHGGDLGGFYALSHEDVERFAPFNTLQGQAWVLALIERLGVDLVIFDNIMSLTQGDQTNELVWQQTMPLVLALTQNRSASFGFTTPAKMRPRATAPRRGNGRSTPSATLRR